MPLPSPARGSLMAIFADTNYKKKYIDKTQIGITKYDKIKQNEFRK
jgi:hypothetical protein